MPPFRPAPLQDAATLFGRHARTEAVAALSFKVTWLKCAFHFSGPDGRPLSPWCDSPHQRRAQILDETTARVKPQAAPTAR